MFVHTHALQKEILEVISIKIGIRIRSVISIINNEPGFLVFGNRKKKIVSV